MYIPYYGNKYYCVIKYIIIKYLEEILVEIIILYNYEIIIYIYIIIFLLSFRLKVYGKMLLLKKLLLIP